MESMNVNYAVINHYLNGRGVKHSNLGFRYLVSAFMIVSAEPDKNTVLTKVYEEVAKKHHTNPNCVERAIRYSIMNQGITNKEFINKAVYELLWYMGLAEKALR